MFKQTFAYLIKSFKYCFLFFIFIPAVFATPWKILAPGIEYIDIGYNLIIPWSHIHVFKINLKENQLELLLARFLDKKNASADEFARFSKALITINGGFFDHKHHPLGLRISHQEQYNPLKNISWWGVFYINGQQAYIKSLNQYSKNKSSEIDFAVQSGPRLIINGYIPTLKPGIAERTALGISANNEVIILVTENAPLSTTTLAKLMRTHPLNCHNALNLDGGSSTQLNAHFNTLNLHVYGLSKVSDAIIVKKSLAPR